MAYSDTPTRRATVLAADSDDDDDNDNKGSAAKARAHTHDEAQTRRLPHTVAAALLDLLPTTTTPAAAAACHVRRRHAVLAQLARVGGAYRVLCSGATPTLWMRYADYNKDMVARLASCCSCRSTTARTTTTAMHARTHTDNDDCNSSSQTARRAVGVACDAYTLTPGDRAAQMLLGMHDSDDDDDDTAHDDDISDTDGAALAAVTATDKNDDDDDNDSDDDDDKGTARQSRVAQAPPRTAAHATSRRAHTHRTASMTRVASASVFDGYAIYASDSEDDDAAAAAAATTTLQCARQRRRLQ